MLSSVSPEIRALEAALLYTPANLRKEHLQRLEELITEIRSDGLYSYEHIFHRVTLFEPDSDGEKLLAGADLRHDLGAILRHLSFTTPLEPRDPEERVLPIEEVASKCRVTTGTVRRWGVSGLPLCTYLLDEGPRALCVRTSALQRFLSQRKSRAAQTPSRMTEAERTTLVERARVLQTESSLPAATLVKRLSQESGRSTTTVRRILRAHESAREAEHMSARNRCSLSATQRSSLVKRYRNGQAVNSLAKQFKRSRATIYRLLHRALVENVLALKVNYIPNPEFAEPDAEQLCLREEGLFTYPPQCGPNMMKAPEGLPPYLTALYSIPLLKRPQEGRLFRKFNYIKYCMATLQEQIRLNGYSAEIMDRFEELRRAADQLRRILIRCNLRLVVSIAKRHVGPLATLFDLVSEGNVCLMRAVECYDYSRNARFATYATWAISKHFARVVPEQNYHLSTFVTGQEEMIAATGDVRPDTREREETVAHIRTIVGKAAAHLSDRERTIIESHFGTNGKPAKTLEEIGSLFGLTRERIRQIEARALGKLRDLISPEAIEGLT